MADSTTITVRLDKDLKDRLEALAVSTRRSKSFLAAEAISAFVETNAWQVAQIEEAVRQADAGGPFVDHEDAMEYLRRRARGETPPRPRAYRG